MCLRHHLARQMMIGNDHLAAQFTGPRHALYAANAGIHRQQHIRWRGSQRIHQRNGQAVTEFEAVGHAKRHVAATHPPQGQHGNCRAGGAIGIKITHHQDTAATADCIGQQVRCRFDTRQQPRGEHVL